LSSFASSNVAVFAVAGTTLVLDQFTKILVRTRLSEGQFHSLVGSSGLVLRMTDSARMRRLSTPQAFLVWVAAVVWFELLLLLGSPTSAVRLTGLGLALGGAAANLTDRFALGGVIDFISFGRWPTFNLADVAMVCGVGVTAASVL
jgi:lipoprotein signal peptidase